MLSVMRTGPGPTSFVVAASVTSCDGATGSAFRMPSPASTPTAETAMPAVPAILTNSRRPKPIERADLSGCASSLRNSSSGCSLPGCLAIAHLQGCSETATAVMVTVRNHILLPLTSDCNAGKETPQEHSAQERTSGSWCLTLRGCQGGGYRETRFGVCAMMTAIWLA